MLFQFNWWKPSHSRRSNSRIRARDVESLEDRVVLSAITGEHINVAPVDDASITVDFDIDAAHRHLHDTAAEIYLPAQHRFAVAGSFLLAPTPQTRCRLP